MIFSVIFICFPAPFIDLPSSEQGGHFLLTALWRFRLCDII
nr:MAG TPA: hypothetical protein [Caudoviricetes sp.]